MFQPLVIFHRGLDQAPSAHFQPESGFVLWNTCVRSLLIGWGPLKTTQNFHRELHGEAAAQFLLQVVCGLRSPVVGETEVHGQFRNLLETIRLQADPDLWRLLNGAHMLARRVRAAHLQGLGSQSYGSFARKKIRGLQSALILGGGHLAQEILPWLAKTDLRLQVAVRDLEKAHSMRVRFPKVTFVAFDQVEQWHNDHDAVLVAAPLADTQVEEILTTQNQASVLLDFRGDSRHAVDPATRMTDHIERIDLAAMFAEIEQNRDRVQTQVKAAEDFIRISLQNLEQEVGRQLASMKIS